MKMPRGHPDFTRYTKFLDMIKGSGEVGLTLVKAELLRNPSFETGDLTGWNYRDAEISTDVIGEATGKYSCRIKPGGAISQVTPLFKCSKFKLVIAIKGEDPYTSHLRVVITHPDLSYTTIDWTGFGDWSWRTWEPTTDKRVIAIAFENKGECDIWVDELQTWLAPQEREITNWPAEYPLPDTQVTSLKTVSVDNFPANYPLPDTQAQGDPLETSGEWTATTAETTLSLNNDFRTLIQFAVSTSAAADVYLEASPDNINWFILWSKLDVTSYCDWDFIAFPYFRVRIPTTGIDIKIWIRAVKV